MESRTIPPPADAPEVRLPPSEGEPQARGHTSWLMLGPPTAVGAIVAGAISLLTASGTRARIPLLLVGGIALLGACLVLGGGPARTLERMRSGWRQPRGWHVFALGSILALPVLAMHTSIVTGDSDSARVVAALVHVRNHGFQYLIDTQETFVPHLVLGALMRIGGIPLMKLFSVVEVQLLSGAVALLAWRVSGRLIGGIAAGVALLSVGSILERAYLLPMYPLMLTAGLLSAYVVYLAASAATRRDRILRAAGAGALLWLCIESHEVGQIFLVFPILMLLSRRVFRNWTAVLFTYVAFSIFYIPRFLVNVSEGGLKNLLTNRVDHWITQGYLLDIQLEFWHLKRTIPVADYLDLAPSGVIQIFGYVGLPLLALALGAFFVMPRRLRVLAAIFFVLTFGIAIGRRLPFYPRYFSPLVVGAAIAGGVAVAHLWRDRSSRILGAVALAMLALGAATALGLRSYEADLLEQHVIAGPYGRLAQELPSGARVIGARATYVNFTRTDVESYGEQFLTERELATFLIWRSDPEAIAIMRERGIEWVMVPRRPDRWVRQYHRVWLVPHYGVPPLYHQKIKESPDFCEVFYFERAALYRLRDGASDACP